MILKVYIPHDWAKSRSPGSKRGQRSSSNQFLWSISINRVSSVLYWWKTVLKFISDWLKIQRNFQKFLNFRAPVQNRNRSEWNWTWVPRTIPGLVTLSEDGPRWPYPNFIGSIRSGSILLDLAHRPEIPDFETNLSRTSSWSIDLSCALTLRSLLGLFHCPNLPMNHKLLLINYDSQ